MKRLYTILLGLLLLTSLQGQILRYSNYTLPAPPSIYTAQYDAILAAMTVDPTGDTLTWQNDMIYSLDSIDYWDRIKLLYVLVNRNEQGAKLNWINPGTYDLTDPGSTVPSFVKYQGYDMDGSTDYLSTSYIPAADSLLTSSPTHYIGVNSTTLSAWTLTGVDGTFVLGALSGTGISTFFQTMNTISPQISSGETSSLGVQTNGSGYTIATRRGKTELEGYFNGVSNGTDNETSYSLQSDAFFIGAYNNDGGGAGGFYDGIISLILVMDDVSDTEATNIYNILHRYMTRIGQ